VDNDEQPFYTYNSSIVDDLSYPRHLSSSCKPGHS
jgi:hypothetical protein